MLRRRTDQREYFIRASFAGGTNSRTIFSLNIVAARYNRAYGYGYIRSFQRRTFLVRKQSFNFPCKYYVYGASVAASIRFSWLCPAANALIFRFFVNIAWSALRSRLNGCWREEKRKRKRFEVPATERRNPDIFVAQKNGMELLTVRCRNTWPSK